MHDFLFVKQGTKTHRLLFSEILYIESDNKYVRIVSTAGKFIFRGPLNTIEQALPGKDFIRIHRSFLVAIRHIRNFERDCVTIGDANLPIGKQYQQQFQRRLVPLSGKNFNGVKLTLYDIMRLYNGISFGSFTTLFFVL